MDNRARVAKKSEAKQTATKKLNVQAVKPMQIQKRQKPQKPLRAQKPVKTVAKKPQPKKSVEPTLIPPVKPKKEQVEQKPVPEKLQMSALLSKPAEQDQVNRESSGENPREATVDLNTKQFKYAYYFGILKRNIQMQWIYPLQARLNKTVGTTILSFSLDKDGKLTGVNILRPSGRKILDEAAVSAIQHAAPFPSLPDDWQLEKLNVTVNFEYLLY